MLDGLGGCLGGTRAARRRRARFLCPSLRLVGAHSLADGLAFRGGHAAALLTRRSSTTVLARAAAQLGEAGKQLLAFGVDGGEPTLRTEAAVLMQLLSIYQAP